MSQLTELESSNTDTKCQPEDLEMILNYYTIIYNVNNFFSS
jgi:hypothetical protein